MTFVQDRILLEVQTHARVGTAVRGVSLGVSLSPTSEVSVAPDGEGETLGFRDARVDRISQQRELKFILTRFSAARIGCILVVDENTGRMGSIALPNNPSPVAGSLPNLSNF